MRSTLRWGRKGEGAGQQKTRPGSTAPALVWAISPSSVIVVTSNRHAHSTKASAPRKEVPVDDGDSNSGGLFVTDDFQM